MVKFKAAVILIVIAGIFVLALIRTMKNIKKLLSGRMQQLLPRPE